MGAYQIGELVGAVIGMAVIGSGLAWCYRRVFRADWTLSVGLGLITLTLVAGFTNSNPTRGYPMTVLIYALAAIPAYFIISAMRPKVAAFSSARDAEPSFGPPLDTTAGEPSQERPSRVRTLSSGDRALGIRVPNWRRGFFRIWAVLALLWCVLVALIASGQILSPYVPDKIVATRSGDVSAALYDTYGEPYYSWSAAVTKGELVATEVRPGFRLFTPPGVAEPALAVRIEEARRLVDAYSSEATAERRTGAIVTLFGAAVIPPLVVLALGWLVGWALAGFAAQRL